MGTHQAALELCGFLFTTNIKEDNMIKMITTGYFEVLPPGVRDSGHIVIPRVIWWEDKESLIKGFTEMIQAALKDTRRYEALSDVRVVCLKECPRDEYDKWRFIRDRKWGARANSYIRLSCHSTHGCGNEHNVVDMLTMFKHIESSMDKWVKNEEVL